MAHTPKSIVIKVDADMSDALKALAEGRYVMEMHQLSALCRALQAIDIDWLLATVERAHTVWPIVDPTGYRDGLGNLRDQERILRAAKMLKDEVEAVAGDGPGQ